MNPQCLSKNSVALEVRVVSIELFCSALTGVLSVAGEGTSLVGTASVSKAVS